MFFIPPEEYHKFTNVFERIQHLKQFGFRYNTIKTNSLIYRNGTEVHAVKAVGYVNRWNVVIQFQEGQLHTIHGEGLKQMQNKVVFDNKLRCFVGPGGEVIDFLMND